MHLTVVLIEISYAERIVVLNYSNLALHRDACLVTRISFRMLTRMFRN